MKIKVLVKQNLLGVGLSWILLDLINLIFCEFMQNAKFCDSRVAPFGREANKEEDIKRNNVIKSGPPARTNLKFLQSLVTMSFT